MATVELTETDRMGLRCAANIIDSLYVTLPSRKVYNPPTRDIELPTLVEHLRELARRARGDGEVGDGE